MPIRGTNHSSLVLEDAPYFKSLADLDQWAGKSQSARKLYGVLPFTPRNITEGVSDSGVGGKLLVSTYLVIISQSSETQRQAARFAMTTR